MHFFCVTSIFVALSALTTAVPHARGHSGLHARGSNFGMIAGRSALEGACGGASGESCQPGYCCSQWGYCGATEDYCGAGCNSAFGTCGAGSSEPTTPTSSSAAASHTTAAPSSSVAAIVTKFHPVPAPTTTTAAPVETITSGSGSGSHAGSDSYKTYTGNGSPSSGWPSEDAWVDFESMWSANLRIISISCTEFGQDNNSDQENDELKSAIQSVASSSGIDERFILAVVMQESKGCVRAPTTNYGVRNPGLMQDHDGTGTCNDGSVSNPCPQSEILQMIKDGTTGTAAGDGLQQCMAESNASDVSKYYKAARIYNSGSVTDDNLSLGVATHCYASDIANRLTGWVDATTSCSL